MAKEVFSICFMCTQRCPIRILVENDDVKWIEGNPHVAGIEGALCAKGSAGLGLLHDSERPQYPMIRLGPRGAGQWQRATWDEALDFVAAKLKEHRPGTRPPESHLGRAEQSQHPHCQGLHERPGLP